MTTEVWVLRGHSDGHGNHFPTMLFLDEAEANKLRQPEEPAPERFVPARAPGHRHVMDGDGHCGICAEPSEGVVADSATTAQWCELAPGELVSRLTEVMREADRAFENVGGSTRHHVRDCLIPELEAAGLKVVAKAKRSKS